MWSLRHWPATSAPCQFYPCWIVSCSTSICEEDACDTSLKLALQLVLAGSKTLQSFWAICSSAFTTKWTARSCHRRQPLSLPYRIRMQSFLLATAICVPNVPRRLRNSMWTCNARLTALFNISYGSFCVYVLSRPAALDFWAQYRRTDDSFIVGACTPLSEANTSRCPLAPHSCALYVSVIRWNRRCCLLMPRCGVSEMKNVPQEECAWKQRSSVNCLGQFILVRRTQDGRIEQFPTFRATNGAIAHYNKHATNESYWLALLIK